LAPPPPRSIYPEGCAATLDPKDLPYLKHALEAPASALYTPAAGLTPEYETVELLSAQFPALSLEELLRKLDTEARLDGRYFLCRQEQMLHAARALRKVRWTPPGRCGQAGSHLLQLSARPLWLARPPDSPHPILACRSRRCRCRTSSRSSTRPLTSTMCASAPPTWPLPRPTRQASQCCSTRCSCLLGRRRARRRWQRPKTCTR
jgi:hypothetical protein